MEYATKSLRNKQNSLGSKIALGFGIIATVLACALIMIIPEIKKADHLLHKIATSDLIALQYSNQLIMQLNQAEYLERQLMLTKDQQLLGEWQDTWEKSIPISLSNLQALYANNFMQMQKLKELSTSIEALKNTQEQNINHSSADNPLNTQNDIVLMKTISEQIIQFKELQRAEVASSLEGIKGLLTTVLGVFIAFLSLSMILFAIMALMLTRSITLPITTLIRSTKQLATGNLKGVLTLDESAEFQSLSLSLNHVISTLRNIASVTEKMAMGDYSQRVEIKSEQDTLAISVNQMLDNFNLIVNQTNAISEGNYSTDITPRSEVDNLGKSLQNMTRILRQNKHQHEEQNWLKDGLAQFANIISETRELATLCNQALSAICHYIHAGSGAIYLQTEDKMLTLMATYAFENKRAAPDKFKVGEGLIGQVAFEKKAILLKKTAELYITSATMQEAAQTVYCLPILYEKKLVGVIELAWNHDIQDLIFQYFDNLLPMLASHIQAARQQEITEQLLQEQRLLAEELQSQQEKLRTANKELNLSSKYKSEFLANMSHELRTPLNSLIILAKLFAENRDKNLNSEQIESAQIMLKSGNDLLTLINDILDLAKVEAGKLEIQLTPINLNEIIHTINHSFKHIAEERKIDFLSELQGDLPLTMFTDELRVFQILRNLISNAIKFTAKGHVKLVIERAQGEEISGLPANKHYLAFRVSDTGIGIPEDKQQRIFEAFQQADGSTSRQYGGTGLGLSISTQLAQLLKGYIALKSAPTKGSTFSLIIPDNSEQLSILPAVTLAEKKPVILDMDTNELLFQHEQILLVDDDMRNVYALSRMLKKHQLEILMAANGKAALDLLNQHPNIRVVLLDLMMPMLDGYQTLEQIRQDPQLSQVPIIVLTAHAMPEEREK